MFCNLAFYIVAVAFGMYKFVSLFFNFGSAFVCNGYRLTEAVTVSEYIRNVESI